MAGGPTTRNAPLYVVLVLGLQVGVTDLAANVVPLRRAGIAPAAFLFAVGIDFVVLGSIVPSPAVVLDRVVLAAGLGVVAAGSAIDAKTGRPILVGGWTLWLWGASSAVGIGLS